MNILIILFTRPFNYQNKNSMSFSFGDSRDYLKRCKYYLIKE